MDVGALLVIIALVMAILGLVVDARLIAVSVLLVCIALLVGGTQVNLR